MLFSSIEFLYYFLPVVLILYFLAPGRYKNLVLLLSSIVFYFYGEQLLVLLMLLSSVVDYCCALVIDRYRSHRIWPKAALGVSLCFNLGMLGYFKYSDFFLSNINHILGTSIPLLRVALPIGISFYTFQTMSYTIDVYRGNAKVQKNLLNFSAYVTLFPQLIAGPIVRYTTVQEELDHRTHSHENFSYGVCRFTIGLSKKILIANQLGELCKLFRSSNEKTIVFYWLYAAAFCLHIYFDFSGYSDMAIGLGRMFGFHFLENFNYPYISASISEFWRRWHISMGTWFRDYVYIPLGGNRVSSAKWFRNVLIVWGATGLWHGADWNFIVWGFYFAFFLLLEKLFLGKWLKKLPGILSHGYVLFFICISFVIFNADGMGQAIGDLKGMFGLAGLPAVNEITLYYLKSYSVILLLGIIGATPLVRDTVWKAKKHPKACAVINVLEPAVYVMLFVAVTAYLVDGSFNPFLYFRF